MARIYILEYKLELNFLKSFIPQSLIVNAYNTRW